MGESTTTRPSLLVKIRDTQDAEAWGQFEEIYAPLIYGYARKQGLQDADAADVTQNVLEAVIGGIKRLEYDSARGSFRGWLFAVARNKICDFRRRRDRSWRGTGDTHTHDLLDQQPEATADDDWDREYERRLFEWAANRVRPAVAEATWQAFWQTAVQSKPARQVAAALGMSVGAVYLAKSRVLARLKEQVGCIEAESLHLLND